MICHLSLGIGALNLLLLWHLARRMGRRRR